MSNYQPFAAELIGRIALQRRISLSLRFWIRQSNLTKFDLSFDHNVVELN